MMKALRYSETSGTNRPTTQSNIREDSNGTVVRNLKGRKAISVLKTKKRILETALSGRNKCHDCDMYSKSVVRFRSGNILVRTHRFSPHWVTSDVAVSVLGQYCCTVC
jgi:hypothetical protein